MATQGYGTDITLLAGADLSAKQFYLVKVSSAGAAVLAGAGEAAVGVVQNEPASGQAATVRYLGKSKVRAGGTIAAGAEVASDANGAAVAATAGRTNTSDGGGAVDPLIGSHVVGVALSAAASGEIVEVLLLHKGAVPTTAA